MRQLDEFCSGNRSGTLEKPSLHRHRRILMHSKEIVTSAGSMNTLRKNVGVRTMEEQRNLIVHNVERHIMDSVGEELQIIPSRFTERWMDRRQKGKRQGNPERWKVQRRKKAETMEKEKVKERRDNVSTKSQNHQRNSGQVDRGNKGLNNLGAQKLTLRVGVTMIATLQIRILRLQQQPKNFSVRLSVICDSRISVMSNTSNLFNMTDWIRHSELSH